MREAKARATGDLLLAAFSSVGAVLLFVGASSLPPPRFEPLGSAAMPRILGTLLILFSLIIAARALLALMRDRALPQDTAEPAQRPANGTLVSVLTFVALVAFVLALDVFRVPFWLATTGFLGCIGLVLSRFDWKAALVYAALGAALGAGLAWLFQNFLYISLG